MKIQTLITNDNGQRFLFDSITKKETYYLTEKKSKYGVMDLDGNQIIEPMYEKITLTDYGYFIVCQGNLKGLIDSNGKFVVKLSDYDDISSSHLDGMVRLYKNNKVGFYYIHTNVVVEPAYDSIEFFSRGMYIIEQDKKFGVIDSYGKIVIKIKYDWISEYIYDFLAKVRLEDKLGYVSKEGKEILSPEYEETTAGMFHYQFCIGRKGKEYTCVDINANLIFRVDLDKGLLMIGGDFVKQIDHKWFDEFYCFSSGIVLAKKDGQYMCGTDENNLLITFGCNG